MNHCTGLYKPNNQCFCANKNTFKEHLSLCYMTLIHEVGGATIRVTYFYIFGMLDLKALLTSAIVMAAEYKGLQDAFVVKSEVKT